jgi:periplasmic protein TonB
MLKKRLEKPFLFLLGLSVLLHLGMYQLARLLPFEKPKTPPEPTVVDLTDLPTPPPKPAAKPKPEPKPVEPPKPKLEPPKAPPLPKPQPPKPPAPPKPAPAKPLLIPKPAVQPMARPPVPFHELPRQTRLGDKTQRVQKEIAPRGDRETGHVTSQRPKPLPPNPPKAAPRPNVSEPLQRKAQSGGMPLERGGNVPVARGEGLFKPKPKEGARQGGREGVTHARLFPSGRNQARLEESYRAKYLKEVEEGNAVSLNTDDIRFASFERRFSDAVYYVWHYPEQAIRQRIDGSTLVKITFKKNGEITNVELLESSGSKVLDDEVFRTLNKLGPVGPLPRQYKEETMNIVCLFHYSLDGGLSYY